MMCSYNDELQWKIQPHHVAFAARHQHAEWSPEGLDFLYRVRMGGCV